MKADYKEKIKDGEKVRELECPEGYKAVDGECVKMSSLEQQHRSDAAHKVKRSHGNKQSHIDRKRNKTIEKNEGKEMVNLTDRQKEMLEIIYDVPNKKNLAITKTEYRKEYKALESKKLIFVLKYPTAYSVGLTDDGKKLAKSLFEANKLRQIIREEIKSILEAKYPIYWQTYAAAIDWVYDEVSKKFKIDDNDWFNHLATGGKPKQGKTKRGTVALYDKNTGKEQRKALAIQVYNMGNTFKKQFELNWYIN